MRVAGCKYGRIQNEWLIVSMGVGNARGGMKARAGTSW